MFVLSTTNVLTNYSTNQSPPLLGFNEGGKRRRSLHHCLGVSRAGSRSHPCELFSNDKAKHK